jgi:membrane-bound metal-dependent hydrolase YbcI (DUF457 family)
MGLTILGRKRVEYLSTPIGHGLFALSLYSLFRVLKLAPSLSYKEYAAFFILAALPDFDALPTVLSQGWWVKAQGHRLASHSLVVAAATGFLLALLTNLFLRSSPHKGLRYLLYPLIIASHAILDASCIALSYPYGTQLLWPFSETLVYFPQWFMQSVGTYRNEGYSMFEALYKTGLRETLLLGGVLALVNGLVPLFKLFKLKKVHPN